MISRSSAVRRFILNLPGYKKFGVLVFMPAFFAAGATLEYAMIHWTVGETNFYSTYKRTQSTFEAERRLENLLQKAGNKSSA